VSNELKSTVVFADWPAKLAAFTPGCTFGTVSIVPDGRVFRMPLAVEPIVESKKIGCGQLILFACNCLNAIESTSLQLRTPPVDDASSEFLSHKSRMMSLPICPLGGPGDEYARQEIFIQWSRSD
jgi:hypothetical protein